MHLWAADSGELTAVLRGHGAAVSAAAWSPLGVPLASCDKNGVALLWES
jgi:WD40 repeat protein